VTSGPADFERLASAHRPAIQRLCRHHEASSEARRDLEQEILVALWRAAPSFRGDCSEKTFVLRVAHNVAVTHVTRAARERAAAPIAAPVASESASPDVLSDQRTALARIEQRLRAMDLASQQLVLLALEGCTMAEIAEVTGLSLTNVTTRLSRLRRALSTSTDESPAGESREPGDGGKKGGARP
jgi:RNA polymerase sigma-70 factor (ECF subfamily)